MFQHVTVKVRVKAEVAHLQVVILAGFCAQQVREHPTWDTRPNIPAIATTTHLLVPCQGRPECRLYLASEFHQVVHRIGIQLVNVL